ncbi:hypothetical protein [Dysgonomonas sp. 520]|uniref:hypothetical protein n=1 Tax=Dysgonomonas sp. 520 TaxID=2302931 RepID=UPI0013D3D5C6|nr:hypothetical protein [Dysgonomonas sp. 520]NDW08844.1 hypothetical protein [Dysgonomonas sp. 520]
MKKSSLILLIFLAVTALKAQVGVNTESPQGVFHIDAARNTSGNTNVADDVVVDAQGRVGVGTNNPQTKVDIRSSTQGGGFRLQDGSQADGRVLTSDASGNAKWRSHGIQTVNAVWNGDSTFVIADTTTQFFLSTGTTLTLPSGRWLVQVAFLVAHKYPITNPMTSPYWIRSSFTDGIVPMGTRMPVTTATYTSDFEGNNRLVAGVGYGLYNTAVGSVVLNNATNANKTYTFIVGNVNKLTTAPAFEFGRIGQGLWLEDNITAIKIQD